MIQANNLPVIINTDDLYNSNIVDEILSIQTFYEQQWLGRGMNIKYIRFICESRSIYIEPEIEIEHDNYKSFSRDRRIEGLKD